MTQTNQCTNPSFEYGTTGWSATGGSLNNGGVIAQITGSPGAFAGTKCLQVTCTAAVNNEGATIAALTGPGGGNWLSGTTYNISMYIQTVSGATALQLIVQTGGGDFALANLTITGAWARYTVNWTPAASVATAHIDIRTQNAAAAVFNIDGVMAVADTVAETYFDGDTAGFVWLGAPGNSQSQTAPPPTPRAYWDRPRHQVLIGQKDVTERCDSIVYSATDNGGFEICTLGLPSVDRPKKGEAITIRQGLDVAWAGRIAEIADHSQHDTATKTTGGEGLRSLLRDTLYSMIYVDRDLTRWGAPSVARQISLLGSSFGLGQNSVTSDPTSGNPSLAQQITGAWASPIKPAVEGWYDAGVSNLIAAVYYDLYPGTLAFDNHVSWSQSVSLSDDANATTLQASANLDPASQVDVTGYFSPATARRFALLSHNYGVTPAGVQGTVYAAYWKNTAVYGNHGLARRGADPGGFYPSDIARHALSQCSGVLAGNIQDATGYIAPHVVYRTPTAADVIVDDMAKLMGWTWGVWEPPTILDTQPRLDFRPPPTDATCVVSKAECDQLDITSRLGDLYDTCTVTYTDAAGASGSVTVTLANPQLYEAGLGHRTLSLSMGTSTSAAATSFANFALALSQIAARAAGSATLPVAVRLPGGGSKPSCLIRPGIDRLRIVDLVDGGPLLDIGTVRRDVFRISRVETTVAKDGSVATVAELDSGTNLLETLQARLALAAAVVGQGATGG